MNRQAQSAVLFLLGAALLHAGATDLYLRYVKAGLRPLLLAAGAVLIVTALATAWYERRRAGGGHGEGHAHPEPRVSWLLILPLLALILVAPPALGSYSATRTGTALQEPLAYPSLSAADPLPLSVVDYAGRAVYDHGRTLAGRTVRLTGFVAVDHEGTPYLVRMALNCCAADAQPVKVGLTGRIPPVLQPDTWLAVTGVYTPRVVRDPVNGGPIPFLEVKDARPVPTPRDPYDESWNN
ncbi:MULTISPECIES: TIGR03943 family putative permease subunit [unclassified Streptomyces]|uniref:TIGR03943 family putative permease subunit n=1 Tax=unclassified Streptomyces TaxID=2593676 RepID=UPI0029BDF6FE|nr:TIGR03943 family protein [Streptomyces sp. FL07-04A]MDX3575522.1 TIGR03943 family protein [Streptomyces sp. FL07-04A]